MSERPMPIAPTKGRPPQPRTLEQDVLLARWSLFPASQRPTARAIAAALGIAPSTWHRAVAGAPLTPAQITAANTLLDAASPAKWLAASEADFEPLD